MWYAARPMTMDAIQQGELAAATAKRRTFAIISHPDAGKTTLTEKLLLFSGAIQIAGSVKARKASRHATSDWMEIEKQRGISVASSVMQMQYRDHVVNLLDTPGYADFAGDVDAVGAGHGWGAWVILPAGRIAKPAWKKHLRRAGFICYAFASLCVSDSTLPRRGRRMSR